MNLFNVLDGVAKNTTYYCGSGTTGFDGVFPQTVHLIYNIILIGVPILLVILGMIDLGKAVTAQKEDEIKKNQQLFFKRVIAAVLVFFVFFAVKIVIGWAADDNGDVLPCLNCFIKGNVDGDSCMTEKMKNEKAQAQGSDASSGKTTQEDADKKGSL